MSKNNVFYCFGKLLKTTRCPKRCKGKQCFYEVRINLIAPVTAHYNFAGEVILRDMNL